MYNKKYIPNKGDIIKVDFSPTSGSEQGGYRPGLVVSSYKYNQISGLCLVLPITSKQKDYMFELLLPRGLDTKGVVLCDHVRSLSYGARKAAFVEATKPEFYQEAIQMLYAVCK